MTCDVAQQSRATRPLTEAEKEAQLELFLHCYTAVSFYRPVLRNDDMLLTSASHNCARYAGADLFSFSLCVHNVTSCYHATLLLKKKQKQKTLSEAGPSYSKLKSGL